MDQSRFAELLKQPVFEASFQLVVFRVKAPKKCKNRAATPEAKRDFSGVAQDDANIGLLGSARARLREVLEKNRALERNAAPLPAAGRSDASAVCGTSILGRVEADLKKVMTRLGQRGLQEKDETQGGLIHMAEVIPSVLTAAKRVVKHEVGFLHLFCPKSSTFAGMAIFVDRTNRQRGK